MNIGIIDADLIDNGTRHPNLACMKLSGYYKAQGHTVRLLETYKLIPYYDKVFVSKVFDFTKTPNLNKYKNVEIGGTGFFGIDAPDLPYEVEHCMPDYHLYDKYIEHEIKRGIKPSHFKDYQIASIGFITRGCFRKCSFCVNRKYDKCQKHADITEFLDPTRKVMYFWDDNFLAYSNWKDELLKISEIGKPFVFRQGLDIRLMTEEKAKLLSSMKYYGGWIFAFDHVEDADLISRKLEIWKRYCTSNTRLYVLVAYDSQDATDIVNAFIRIEILMKYGCIPYIMRYKDFKESEYRGMYIALASWCNQPAFFKKLSFRQFCEKSQGARLIYMTEFEKKHPNIARRFFDIRFEDLNEYKK